MWQRAERRYNLLDVTGIMAEELVTSLCLGKPEELAPGGSLKQEGTGLSVFARIGRE